MFKHILANEYIEAFIGKGQLFQVLAARTFSAGSRLINPAIK